MDWSGKGRIPSPKRFNNGAISCNYLEVLGVHLPVPKNYLPEDIKFKKDTPIFATSLGKIRNCVAGVVYERETEVMDCQWNTFKFHYQIDPTELRELQPCPHCSAKLIVEH